ncbi:hypothetical protein Btru_071864 [Bulinus truncatus]|nr:hypothetical protein Btru_071864 [Bulinus truncatus]
MDLFHLATADFNFTGTEAMIFLWFIVLGIYLEVSHGNEHFLELAKRQRMARCTANKGFVYVEYLRTRLCLYWSTEFKNYMDAKEDCMKRGANMMTVRNWDRMKVLRHQPHSRWVGLRHGVNPMTGKDKDCIYFMRFNLLLDDLPCASKLLYVCETNKF